MTWSVLGESVAGTSHLARNTPCQDAFRCQVFGSDSEWAVLAVADGAGSASHSEIGAALACDEFIQRMEPLLREFLVSKESLATIFKEVHDSLLVRAEQLGVRPRELACTALLVVAGPESTTFAQLGDGAIVVGDGQQFSVLHWPEPAEYANATDFLTDDRYAELLQVGTTACEVAEIAVLTDGLQRLALDFASRTPHPAFFRPFFNGLRSANDLESLQAPLREFLDSPRVNERTDDDKTLLLAIRRP